MDNLKLQYLIAKRLGWKDLQLYTDWSAVKHVGADMNTLHGTPPGENPPPYLVSVPNWPEDSGEALDLCLNYIRSHCDKTGEKWQISMACVGPIYYGAMFVYDNQVQKPGLFRAKTASRALCDLWSAAIKQDVGRNPD